MKRENNPIPRFLFASLLSFPAQPSLLLVLSGCPLLALPSPQVCLPGLTPLGTLSLSLSDIITIRPRLYFLSPLSPFSLLLTSSHQFSPILWNISPPTRQTRLSVGSQGWTVVVRSQSASFARGRAAWNSLERAITPFPVSQLELYFQYFPKLPPTPSPPFGKRKRGTNFMKMGKINLPACLSIYSRFLSPIWIRHDMSTGMCCVCRSLGICEIFFFQSQKRFLGCAKVMYGDTPGISRSMSSLLATSLSLDRADTRQFLFSLRFLLLCVDRWVQFFVNLLWGPMLTCLTFE